MHDSDFTFENHGSIWLCRANNTLAQEWLQDHVDSEAQWFGIALVVEPRYVDDLKLGLELDGFDVN